MPRTTPKLPERVLSYDEPMPVAFGPRADALALRIWQRGTYSVFAQTPTYIYVKTVERGRAERIATLAKTQTKRVRWLKRVILAEIESQAQYYDDPISDALGVAPPPYPMRAARERIQRAMDRLNLTLSDVMATLSMNGDVECSLSENYAERAPSEAISDWLWYDLFEPDEIGPVRRR